MKKYLSIITNFGCHYTCPYCIVKNNDIEVPKTTVYGLIKLPFFVIKYGCNILSVSGGGDPLHNYKEHKKWWNFLFKIVSYINLPVEVHTFYINGEGVYSVAPKTERMVYHLRKTWQLPRIRRIGNEKVRVVFVITDDMKKEDLYDISLYCGWSPNIDELTFRQRVDKNYETSYHLHDELIAGHKKDWWYVEQDDYNLYYAENNIYEEYSSFKKKGKA